ncbi:MAG: 5-formyltetrahydrofolate cyclo-ligase [Gammaproteobacteria bacterium]|nr:5-formyltetrahydrofolate cyclo-ligase [Gammaproteobacteria bacterium]
MRAKMTHSSTNGPTWRQERRKCLVRKRQAISAIEKPALDEAIGQNLAALLATMPKKCVAVFWPLPGEPELAECYDRFVRDGFSLALPVVVTRERPLVFRYWTPGESLDSDLLKIPCPRPSDPVDPEIVVLPCVGFDSQGYRLGNGGGYYDRTLAELESRPVTIGVAYERTKLPSIRPQVHDIPIDYVATEKRVYSIAGLQTE